MTRARGVVSDARTVVAALASAEIELILPGERVTSTLSSAGETRWAALAGVEGGRLGVVVTAPHGSRVRPRLRVLDPDGEPAEIGETNPRSGPVARVAGLRLAKTGVWRIGVETPSDHGGKFVLVTNGNVPRAFRWSAALDGAGGPAEHVLPATPGCTLTLVVASKGKPLFNPSLELIAPSGAVVTHATGRKGRATLSGLRLEEIGRYTVRVAGGPGTFSAAATVKLPRKRKLAFADVAAQPEIRSFTPTSTPDDSVASISFQGVGFTMQQSASIASDGKTLLAAPMKAAGSKGAAADIDLGELPPGTYSLRVGTPEGRIVTAAEPFVVTNRVPSVGAADPPDGPSGRTFRVDVKGVGFDVGSTIEIRHGAQGAAIPFTVTDHADRDVFRLSLTPPAHLTGPCDVEVRDPGGASSVRTALIDLLGYRSAPQVVLTSPLPNLGSTLYPSDAVVDESNGRVLAAVTEDATHLALVLFDASTLAVLDTVQLTAADLGAGAFPIWVTALAWDRVGGTFAVCVGSGTSQPLLVARTISAGDIRHTIDQKNLVTGSPKYISGHDVAADPNTGGYVVVWDEFQPTPVPTDLILAQSIPASGVIDTAARRTLATDTTNASLVPSIAPTVPGSFLVAWGGTTNDLLQVGLFASLVDQSLSGTLGPVVLLSSTTWTFCVPAGIAQCPHDDWAMVAFDVHDVDGLYHPHVMRVNGRTLEHGGPVNVDPATDPPTAPVSAVTTSIVWNDERNEFVIGQLADRRRVLVRRVNPNGTVRIAPTLEAYEAGSGRVYAGSAAGSMGLLRKFDGIANDLVDEGATWQIVAAPLR